ncbi:MAG: aryl-sulfate sulfotransferase [Candidatus Heimdallarchaeota archaeon]
MKHLKQRIRTAKRNIGAKILLLMVILFVPSTSVAPHHLTLPTNQLLPSIHPDSLQILKSKEKWQQEPSIIELTKLTDHQSSINMEKVEINVSTHKSPAFDGYNIFILDEEERTPPDFTLNVYRSLIVTNMEGELIKENDLISFPQNTWVLHVEFLNSTTLLYGTQKGAALWDIYKKTEVDLGWGYHGISHHEYEYNPINNTFFTFRAYITEINGTNYEFDMIEEYTPTGQLIWSLDTHSFISHTQWCPFRDTHKNDKYSGPVADLLHSNSLFFDVEEDVLYYHARNLNTFYKIDHKTGQVLWGLGEYGNFTLFDRHGNPRKNLFYHAHAVEKVDDNTFLLFDNDYHNQTNPNSKSSRILELQINETTMTANESWVWTAPPDYYSLIYGDADRLPNGNRLGTFGSGLHYYDDKDLIGPRLVEVSDDGQIMWELNIANPGNNSVFNVYRMERFRLSPILNSPPDILALSQDNVTVSWQTWYNFRAKRRMNGFYTLYLDGNPIETGTHVFDKFWRPTNLTANLGNLKSGDYNLTLALADEAGHLSTDSLNVSIVPFYLNREGPQTIYLGQENAFIQWKGRTSKPLLATINRNNTQLTSFIWNGSVISLDLNSFEPGTYFVTLNLFDNTKHVYNDGFLVTIYPVSTPTILSFPVDQSIIWNESRVLSWELFTPYQAYWNIFINDSLTTSGSWDNLSHILTWNVPILDEGRYNITLTVFNRFGHSNSRTTWLTVISPTPPVIATTPHQTEIQWGQKNTSLRWEIHGGTHWVLWKNGTEADSGAVTSTQIEVRIENWQRDWHPGTYNLTIQVTNEDGVTVTNTIRIRIWVNLGDAYADSIVRGFSMWYWDGENALGPPDGKFTRLYYGYGNGHVTLDMGLDEEIRDGKGVDFMVYARKGSYAVFVGNNLSAPLLIGNQTPPPLTLLGEGFGNTSFDLASADLVQARYIQVVYIAGEEVELDAVMAVYFNQPPKPASNLDRWRIPVFGGVLALFAIVILWVRKRK